MQIYIEYVIINNLLVNALILYLVGIIVRARISFLRIALSSLVGMIYAVLLPYIAFKYDIFLKILLSIIMIIIAYEVKSFKDFLVNIVTFYMLTFLFGGVIIGIGYMANSNFMNALLYPNDIGMGLLALAIILITIFLRILIKLSNNIINRRKYLYNVNIKNNGKSFLLKGYLDSGNKLYYNLSMVIVVNKKYLNAVVNQNNNKDMNYIKIKTVNKDTYERVYKCDEIEIICDNKSKFYKDIYMISANVDFKNYQVLLHGDM